MRKVLMAALFASLAACGGSDGTTAPNASVGGTWTGIVGGQTLTMPLVESAGAVTGTGTITNTPTGTRALTVTGTLVSPKLTATMSSGTLQPIALQATVAGSSMTGSLTGSGFTGEGITLARQ